VHGGGIHQRWLQRARANRTGDGVAIASANDVVAPPRRAGLAIFRAESATTPRQVRERQQ
jgi:hypothetical protein